MTAFDYEAAAQERNRRNKLLRGAAPDLLAALEWAVETADAEQYEADWYAAARAAITKATGA